MSSPCWCVAANGDRFYLLVSMGLHGYIGQLTQSLGLNLTFTRAGDWLGVLFPALVVQPLRMPSRPSVVNSGAVYRGGPWDAFFTVVLR
jgi:molybdate transport system permease protein